MPGYLQITNVSAATVGLRTLKCIGVSISNHNCQTTLMFPVVPIISLVPFGVGLMGIFAPLQTYMIDCFPQFAASAIAGMTALRCLFGALLPLAGPKMYESLGLGWGNSMLGFLAIAFIPVPALLFKYGKTIRQRWPINV
jgi:hypothetical protein